MSIKIFVIEEENKKVILNLANEIANKRKAGIGTIKIISVIHNDEITLPTNYINIYTFTEFVKDKFKAESVAKTILSVIYLEGYAFLPVISIDTFISIYSNIFENYSKFISMAKVDDVKSFFFDGGSL